MGLASKIAAANAGGGAPAGGASAQAYPAAPSGAGEVRWLSKSKSCMRAPRGRSPLLDIRYAAFAPSCRHRPFRKFVWRFRELRSTPKACWLPPARSASVRRAAEPSAGPARTAELWPVAESAGPARAKLRPAAIWPAGRLWRSAWPRRSARCGWIPWGAARWWIPWGAARFAAGVAAGVRWPAVRGLRGSAAAERIRRCVQASRASLSPTAGAHLGQSVMQGPERLAFTSNFGKARAFR